MRPRVGVEKTDKFCLEDEGKRKNIGIQQERKEFWLQFKSLCSDIKSRLDDLKHGLSAQNWEDRDDIKEKIKDVSPSHDNAEIYITALSNVRSIRQAIGALRQFTMHNITASELGQRQNSNSILTGYFLKNSMPELPMADVRLVNIELSDIDEKADLVQLMILPKEKFRFRRYRALVDEQKSSLEVIETRVEKEQENEDKKLEDNVDTLKTVKVFDELTISGRDNSKLVVDKTGSIRDLESNKDSFEKVEKFSKKSKSILVKDLDNCNVYLHGDYKSVHILDITNSTIFFTEPILGPVHMTNCRKSTFDIPFCQQLRIHDSDDVKIKIHVISGPIIETCSAIKFYQKDFPPNKSDNDENFGPNLYWDVKDFNWLKNSVKSPNFEVFTCEEMQLQDHEYKAGEHSKLSNLTNDQDHYDSLSSDDEL